MSRIKPYWRIFRTSLREDGANPARLLAGLIQNFLRIMLVLVIYGVAYKYNPNPGISFANTMWTFGLFFSFAMNLGIRNIARTINTEVQLGTIETSLIKPLDWRLVKLCELLGKSSLEFLLQLVVLPIVLYIAVGWPDVSYLTLPIIAGLVVMLVFAVLVPAMLFTLVGLTAVWTNDALSLFRVVDKMSVVMTGSLVPIALLPGVMQTIVRWSPFGVYASPQLIFTPNLPALIVPMLVSGVLWVLVLFGASQLVWNRVERKLEVNGG